MIRRAIMVIKRKRCIHDAFPERPQKDVRKHLNEQSGRLAPASRVLQLTQAAQVGQNVAHRRSMMVWKLLHQPVQLHGALVVSGRACFAKQQQQHQQHRQRSIRKTITRAHSFIQSGSQLDQSCYTRPYFHS